MSCPLKLTELLRLWSGVARRIDGLTKVVNTVAIQRCNRWNSAIRRWITANAPAAHWQRLGLWLTAERSKACRRALDRTSGDA